MKKYLLVHDWTFADGKVGHYEVSFSDFELAYDRFMDLVLCIETDSYDFDAFIPVHKDGELSFSIYDVNNPSLNRQDLVLKEVDL